MAVVETGQVTGAARALGITQSAASQHLRTLESGLGCTLFDRARRPMALTHAGRILSRRAFRVLSEVEDLKSDLRHLRSTSLPILRIALLASIATSLTPGLYAHVTQDLGVPELVLSAGLASDHHNALMTRRADVAVTSEPLFDMAGFRSIPILEEPYLLVLPSEYDGPTGDVEALATRLTLVRFGAETPVGRRTEQHLQRCRIDLRRSMEADRASMVVAGVITGRCFAILTPSLLIDAVAEGMALRVAPLPFPGFRRTIRAIAREGELGDIPEQVAACSAALLRAQFETRFPDLPEPVLYHR